MSWRYVVTICIYMTVILLSGCAKTSIQSDIGYTPARVDYDSFQQLTNEVAGHRKTRIVGFDQFLSMATESGTLILDARSRELFEQSHISGAINLPFTEFTEENLARIIPSSGTRILIYCNNNIEGDSINFADKSAPAEIPGERITLALNIPTYINLYGYGYRNVYELGELVFVGDERLQLISSLQLIEQAIPVANPQ